MLNDPNQYANKASINVEGTIMYLSEKVMMLEHRIAKIEKELSPLLPEVFDFGQALKLLKAGYHLTRKCWRNRDIKIWMDYGLGKNQADELRVMTIAGVNCVWCPNHSELLADDWKLSGFSGLIYLAWTA